MNVAVVAAQEQLADPRDTEPPEEVDPRHLRPHRPWQSLNGMSVWTPVEGKNTGSHEVGEVMKVVNAWYLEWVHVRPITWKSRFLFAFEYLSLAANHHHALLLADLGI